MASFVIATYLLFLGFSLDEVAQPHELFGGRSDSLLPGGTRRGTGFSRTGIWMFLLGLPFAIFFGALAWALRTYFQRAPGAFVKTFAGVDLMIVGAVGIESLAKFSPKSYVKCWAKPLPFGGVMSCSKGTALR